MIIQIDLTTVPPTTTLLDPDDFSAFKVLLRGADDAFVAPDALRALAGDRATDPAWNQGLEAMLAYAKGKGWVRDADGAIQAHVETAPTA